MISVRRWYIYLVCALSLQSVTWAAIALLRERLTLGAAAEVTGLAFQIAVLVIGLPLFLVHWRWAQRLAAQDNAERASTVRRLYLYGMLAGFLAPFLVNAFDLTATLLTLVLRAPRLTVVSPTAALIRAGAALISLAPLWFYHRRLAAAPDGGAADTGSAATVRRVYVFGFSAVGVALVTLATITLLHWLLFQFGERSSLSAPRLSAVIEAAASLIVGAPVWLGFGGWAQRLFTGPQTEEKESALRKFYLYAIVVIAVLTAVTNLTAILAGLFRRGLSLPAAGDLRLSVSTALSLGGLWLIHARLLKTDAAQAREAPRQAGIHRLYLYLIAAVGLAAFLVGLGGDLSSLLRGWASGRLDAALKEQLAWFTAALVAGLPIWLLAWRPGQAQAVAATPAGSEARRSVVRKLYLYGYLLIATVTVLVSAVYIVYRVLSRMLGEPDGGNLLADLGQATAFTLIGGGVWLYHGWAVRRDGRISRREQASQFADVRVAVVDLAGGSFGRAVITELRQEMPELVISLIERLSPAGETTGWLDAARTQLLGAGLIVAPWTVAVAGGAADRVTAEVARTVVASPARKLMVPIPAAGWDWAGLEHWNAPGLVQQTARAVKQFLDGDAIQARRPMGAGAQAGLVIGIVLVLVLTGLILFNLAALPVMLYASSY